MEFSRTQNAKPRKRWNGLPERNRCHRWRVLKCRASESIHARPQGRPVVVCRHRGSCIALFPPGSAISTCRNRPKSAPLPRPANRKSFDQLQVRLAFTSWGRATCKPESPGTRVCAPGSSASHHRAKPCACAAGLHLPRTMSITSNVHYLAPEMYGRSVKPDADAEPLERFRF